MKKLIIIIMVGVMICMTGCQKTPDKSAVTSKENGLDESAIAEPIEDGEVKQIDMPEHWSAVEKRDDDNIQISADLELGEIEVGNLPVLEMKNRELNQNKLEQLVELFSSGEQLYEPQIKAKNYYQQLIDRIDNKEGAYADVNSLGYHQEIRSRLEEAMELAPESESDNKEVKIKFQNKIKDEAFEIAQGEESESENEVPAFFVADVGQDRNAHIEAETYNTELENDSKFEWSTGAAVIDIDRVEMSLRSIEDATDEYSVAFKEILDDFLNTLNQTTFDEENALNQAEEILKKIEAPEVSLLSSEKILWFPNGSCLDQETPGDSDDLFWQADLMQAEQGYRFEFTREISGLSTNQIEKNIAVGTLNSSSEVNYAPTMTLEKITIVVTEEGVKVFSWVGMAEEKETIAENTNLCSFETIQTELFDQIFYWYSSQGQSGSESLQFSYTIESCNLGYSYITAYENPQNAWLVPAWTFEVMERKNAQEYQVIPYTINALDGSVIS